MDTPDTPRNASVITWRTYAGRLSAARRTALSLLLLALFAAGGCGGSVDRMNPAQISGTLDENDSRFSDGSLSDFYVATARRDGRAQIEMNSSSFDPYLIVTAQNSHGEYENIVEDNNSGEGRNAKIIFDVKKGKTYFIAALDNSAALSPGPYTIIFSDILNNARVNPDSVSGRSALAPRRTK